MIPQACDVTIVSCGPNLSISLILGRKFVKYGSSVIEIFVDNQLLATLLCDFMTRGANINMAYTTNK